MQKQQREKTAKTSNAPLYFCGVYTAVVSTRRPVVRDPTYPVFCPLRGLPLSTSANFLGFWTNPSPLVHKFPPLLSSSTGISSQIRTKLHDWAFWQASASCYSQAALSWNDSKTLYYGHSSRSVVPNKHLPYYVRLAASKASLAVASEASVTASAVLWGNLTISSHELFTPFDRDF